MSKPFLSLDKQIDLMISRSMTVEDPGRVKRYLLSNNYYNVINLYGKFFLESSSPDIYRSGTDFNEIAAVHLFEKEMRSTLLKYILVIEGNLRALVSHTFSKHHPNKYDYLNTQCFDQNNLFEVTTNLSKIVKYLSYASETKNSAAAHYMKKHASVPLWVIVNVFDFGTIENFYKHMLPSERNEVARFYSEMYFENYSERVRISPDTLSSFLANIRELRNVLAHDNKLIRFACRKSCVYFPPIHDLHQISANSARQDVFNIFLVMKVFLSAKDFSILHNTLLKRSISLKKKLKTIPVSEVYKAYGFPEDWDTHPHLEQDDIPS